MTWQPPIGKDISSTLLLWQTISDSADWKVCCKAQIMVGRHNWWYIDERIHNYCGNAVLAVASIAIVKQHVLIFTKKDNISWNRIYVHLLIGLTTDVNCAQNPPSYNPSWAPQGTASHISYLLAPPGPRALYAIKFAYFFILWMFYIVQGYFEIAPDD